MLKVLTFFASIIFRILAWTLRYEFRGLDHFDEVIQTTEGKNLVFAVWHQHSILGLLTARRFPIVVIISQSKDGELIAQVSQFLGMKTVRGSSTRGGRKAKEQLIDILREKRGVGAITVDGPRGPAHQPKSGIIDIAKQSGVPIIPYVPIAEKNWVFEKSWDHFRVPKPFSKVIIQLGKPIWIKSDTQYAEYENYKKILKEALERIEAGITFS
jgi:lysophospholipid acyltransferase (LPLAT)-like uncharacterized protein